MLLSVRFGFATNSSSSHSIVFLPPRLAGKVRDTGKVPEFGWDLFTAASPAAKRDYFAITLLSACGLPHDTEYWGAEAEPEKLEQARALIGRDPPGGYVDHQSVVRLPDRYEATPETPAVERIDLDFAEAFERFLLRPDVAILGGNDNDDAVHGLLRRDGVRDARVRGGPYGTNAPRLPLDGEGGPTSWVARFDPAEGGYWTLFDRRTGTKVRVAFERTDELFYAPQKATAPELVDVKITDACPFTSHACGAHCYQASTRGGAHAPLARLEALARTLGALRVFEVALGGGEPTRHPDFVAVLAAFRAAGVVPSFTTRALDWLEDPARREAVLAHCGAFAYTVHSAAELAAYGARTRSS